MGCDAQLSKPAAGNIRGIFWAEMFEGTCRKMCKGYGWYRNTDSFWLAILL